jgi:hypothetical protein
LINIAPAMVTARTRAGELPTWSTISVEIRRAEHDHQVDPGGQQPAGHPRRPQVQQDRVAGDEL